MKCIIDRQVVLSRVPEGPLAAQVVINPAISYWTSSTVCNSQRTMSGDWMRLFPL